MGKPTCKNSRLTQKSCALVHGSIRHSPLGVSSALMLVFPGRQRTGVQVGDGGELWDGPKQRVAEDLKSLAMLRPSRGLNAL